MFKHQVLGVGLLLTLSSFAQATQLGDSPVYVNQNRDAGECVASCTLIIEKSSFDLVQAKGPQGQILWSEVIAHDNAKAEGDVSSYGENSTSPDVSTCFGGRRQNCTEVYERRDYLLIIDYNSSGNGTSRVERRGGNSGGGNGGTTSGPFICDARDWKNCAGQKH